MSDGSKVSIGAFVVAVAALGWTAVRELRPPPAAPCDCGAAASAVPAPAAAGPGVGPLALRMTELERRLALVETRLRDAGAAAPAAPPTGAPAVPVEDKFVSLKSPHPAVRVEQDQAGAFAAHNSDPALTGKTLVVEGRRADGSIEKISITVPAPGK